MMDYYHSYEFTIDIIFFLFNNKNMFQSLWEKKTMKICVSLKILACTLSLCLKSLLIVLFKQKECLNHSSFNSSTCN